MTDERLEANKAMWDERVAIHVDSEFYDVDSFRSGRITLAPFEIDELGDLAGKDVVHLQCHFGMDGMSLARLGAQSVTGIDFSQAAVEAATALAQEVGLGDRVRFVVSDVANAAATAGNEIADIVYTSWGVLIWLPDLDAWAQNIAAMLKPGAFLYLAESHPFINPYEEEEGVLVERYSYGGGRQFRFDEPGTYADLSAATVNNESYEFTHSLGDIITALANAGLRIEWLHEHDTLVWPFAPSLMTQGDDGLWRWKNSVLPLSFSLKATKPASRSLSVRAIACARSLSINSSIVTGSAVDQFDSTVVPG